MTAKPLKSILSEPTIDLFEDIDNNRPIINKPVTNRAEQLFDNLFGKCNKKVDTYANRYRKPFTKINANVLATDRTIDVYDDTDDEEDGNENDKDFEPSIKTSKSKTKAKAKGVKFAVDCDQRERKKPLNNKKNTKKKKDYPDCTKDALLRAFESAGLPDFEEISKFELHVTNVKDVVRADPPTPPMQDILRPFEDLIDWRKQEDYNMNLITTKPSKSQNNDKRSSSDWETADYQNDSIENDNVFIDSDANNSTQKSSVISNKQTNKRNQTKRLTNSRNRSKINASIKSSDKRRESVIITAGLGASRKASTPVRRKHNVTIKNLSPILSIDTPDDSDSKKAKVIENETTFVAPFPPRPAKTVNKKSYKVPKVSSIPNTKLEIVKPLLSDVESITGQNRSKSISRTLIDLTEPTFIRLDSEESGTLVNITAINKNSNSNENVCPMISSVSTKSGTNYNLRNTTTNELSSIFAPNVKSTPLVTSKVTNLSKKYELIVDRSLMDRTLSKMCHSNSTSKLITKPKTTTIVAVLDNTVDSTTRAKKLSQHNASVYHMYRKSIASVQSSYQKMSQFCRTIVKTDSSICSHTLDDLNQTVRTDISNAEDLKQFINISLSQTMFSTSKLITNGKQTVLSAKQKVLLLCEPNDVIEFNDVFDRNILKNCRKIGEGSYGEVFASKDNGLDIVIKIIPLVNSGKNQSEEELFAQILPELVISKEFNRLKSDISTNCAPNFIDMLRVNTTRGLFPTKLIKEWDIFDAEKFSENEDPRTYDTNQLYIVLQLANGGTDLEAYKFSSSVEAISLFAQLCLALAAAEVEYEFEHRDMHWGNVLIAKTDETQLKYTVNEMDYCVKSNGVLASLIDFSLSRMKSDGFIIYDDLAKYNDLFEGNGDYQFDIYRKMRDNNQNDWQTFKPKSNIFWLHYILDKVIKSKKYSSNRTKVHKTGIQLLKSIFDAILKYDSAFHLVRSHHFKQFCVDSGLM
ncbi:uncharacterized protein LOC128962116 [Oppia nitens]|uniref:uncharacterized protein LOC128962116 n=1 Tax=Oppia nitens TaxID=1686743 RepID=UPI0023DB9DC7|nr:uncharacterized protein LOC128962116 [Oppia nitens]